jgi:hypothetical protein
MLFNAKVKVSRGYAIKEAKKFSEKARLSYQNTE